MVELKNDVSFQKLGLPRRGPVSSRDEDDGGRWGEREDKDETAGAEGYHSVGSP